MPKGWPDFTVPITIEAVTVETLPIDIAAQTVGNIAIDIAAQTVGNLNVNIAAQTANVNVDIKAQTVDLNIKTSGGVNLVIDKLTQTAYVSRRSTLSNNGETALWRSVTGDNRDGKFFPRGCRGFLGIIEVYCRQTVAGDETITVYLSPHPSMGPVASATIDVPEFSSPAWRGATFNRMWNYDSMFIFIVTSNANVGIAYDEASPDRFSSTDAGATWTADPHNRDWFRAVMEGETVGDLPVSGTINTIEIPHQSAVHIDEEKTIGAVETTLKEVEGSGYTEFLMMRNTLRDNSDDTIIRVYADGNLAFEWSFYMLNYAGYTPTTPKISLLKYTENGLCIVHVTLKFEFQRSLKITAQNTNLDQDVWVEGLANLIK